MLPAGIGYMAGCRLVTMLVGSRGRVGLVTPTPSGYLPALFGGPFHVQPAVILDSRVLVTARPAKGPAATGAELNMRKAGMQMVLTGNEAYRLQTE